MKNDVVLEFSDVSKKFKKGDMNHDSLRDLIPAIWKRKFSARTSEDLDKREFWALRNVSFQVRRGEALGIIGPNGAGKSTILKLLSNILAPTSGNIRKLGRLSALIEVGAGFHPDLTGRENIYLNGIILGMKKEEIREKIDSIIDFSGLHDFIDTPVKRYSSGMYARLGFSVSAYVDPEILLVDEVLSVGDFTFQQKCIDKMNEIVKGGTTVIFISHNIPAVIKLCPHAILLNKGEIKMFGDSKDVSRYYYSSHASANTKGNNMVSINKVSLLNEKGQAATTFETGDRATVKISVHCNEKVEKLLMGFMVKKNDGMMVFDANSDKISGKNYTFREGEDREIIIEFRVNLPNGAYFLGSHFMDDMGNYYVFDDQMVEFYVNAPNTLGDAFLDIAWK